MHARGGAAPERRPISRWTWVGARLTLQRLGNGGGACEKSVSPGPAQCRLRLHKVARSRRLRWAILAVKAPPRAGVLYRETVTPGRQTAGPCPAVRTVAGSPARPTERARLGRGETTCERRDGRTSPRHPHRTDRETGPTGSPTGPAAERPVVCRDAPPRVWTIGVVCSRPKVDRGRVAGVGDGRGLAHNAGSRRVARRRHTAGPRRVSVGPHAGRRRRAPFRGERGFGRVRLMSRGRVRPPKWVPPYRSDEAVRRRRALR